MTRLRYLSLAALAISGALPAAGPASAEDLAVIDLPSPAAAAALEQVRAPIRQDLRARGISTDNLAEATLPELVTIQNALEWDNSNARLTIDQVLGNDTRNRDHAEDWIALMMPDD